MRQGQRHHGAAAPGAGGAAGAVHVVLAVAGGVHVQHQVDAVDVNAARGDVGRHQRVERAALEAVEHGAAGLLGESAVQRVGAHPGLAQLCGDPVAAQLGADEGDGAALAPGDRRGDGGLRSGLDHQHVMAHGRHRGGRRVDLVGHRLLQVTVDQGADLVLQRRREQHALAVGGNLVEDLDDLGQETHVRHAVRLVEDGHRHGIERADVAAHQVAKAAGRGHQDIDAAPQRLDLAGHGRAAAHHLHVEVDRAGVRVEVLGHLHGQLPRGGEDQAARVLGLGLDVVGGQRHQQRQAEAQGLSGAGAAPSQHVPSGQCVGDGGGLDRERRGDAVVGQGLHDRLGQAEFGEVRGVEGVIVGLLGVSMRHRAGTFHGRLGHVR
jgi:hypothetical protein